jgi:hypothetical protein
VSLGNREVKMVNCDVVAEPLGQSSRLDSQLVGVSPLPSGAI